MITRVKITAILLVHLLVLINGEVQAQDAHFSQFYSSPTFLSPSLAGSTGGTRFVANYRNQWPGITKTYQTYSVSADLYFSEFKSGVGVLLVDDQAGSASLNSAWMGLQYSYRVKLGDYLQFIPGMQFTLGQKSLDRNKLIFPDELVTGVPSSGQLYLTNTKAQFLDLETSVFLYSITFWIGVTADHLLKPSYSFMGDEATLPMKFVTFGGLNLFRSWAMRNEQPRSASLCYRFEYQKDFKQLDFGGYWYGRALDYGIWYRGLPVFKNDQLKNHFLDHDAVVLSLGLTTSYYHIGYSYDLQLSGLSVYGTGAHEISLILEMGELFGCGLKYLDCFKRRKANDFNENQPRNMKFR